MKKLFLFVLLLLALGNASAWWNGSYSTRFLYSTSNAIGGTINSMPIPILTNRTFWGGQFSDDTDTIAQASDLVNWNGTNNLWWVQPSWLNTTGHPVYYYNATNQTVGGQNGTNATGVYNGIMAWYHAENASTIQGYDSVGNAAHNLVCDAVSSANCGQLTTVSGSVGNGINTFGQNFTADANGWINTNRNSGFTVCTNVNLNGSTHLGYGYAMAIAQGGNNDVLIISKTTEQYFFVTTNGGSRTYNPAFGLSINTWHDLCLVYDGSNMLSYIDGQLNNTAAGAAQTKTWTAGTRLYWGRSGSANEELDGKVDELMILNYSASAAQIMAYHNATTVFNAKQFLVNVPTDSNPTVNTTVNGSLARFSTTWTVSAGTLSNYTFALDNGNGTLYNTTILQNFSGTVNVSNWTAYLNTTPNSLIRYQFWACGDQSCAAGAITSFRVTENLPPTWANIRTNSTIAGSGGLILANWADNFQLSNWTTEYDGGNGTFYNTSTTQFIGVNNVSNLSITINATPGSTVRVRFYAVDVYGNMNATDILSFATAGLSGFAIDATNYTEFTTANVSINYYNLFNAVLSMNFSEQLQNGTFVRSNLTQSVNGSGTFYAILSTFDANSTLIEWRNFSATWFINGTRTDSSTNLTANVFRILVTNCSYPGVNNFTTLQMFIRDEESNALLNNATIEASIDAQSLAENYTRNYAFLFNLTNTNNQTLCISPAWAQYHLGISLVYYATGYSTRSYFASDNFTNTTQSINLYLLASGLSSQVIEYVVDQNNLPVTGVIVKTQRFFTGTNSYVTVAQIQTDYEGKGSVNLRVNDVYYRFILQQNNTVVTQIAPFVIVCAQGNVCPPYYITLPLSQQDIPNYFQWVGELQYSCNANNATGVFQCTINDPTGLSVGGSLLIDRKAGINFANNCTATAITSAATLTCALGNVTGNFYTWKLYLTGTNGNSTLISFGTLDYTTGALSGFGNNGLLIALLIFLVMGLAGIYNPSVGLVLGIAALVGSFVLGILPVTIAALIGVIAIAFAIMWLRR